MIEVTLEKCFYIKCFSLFYDVNNALEVYFQNTITFEVGWKIVGI